MGSREAVEYADDLRRRRNASCRLPPLDSGHRDPWQPYRGACGGYREAAEHLHAHDLLPAPPRDLADLRALWKDNDTRQLAQQIAARWAVTA